MKKHKHSACDKCGKKIRWITVKGEKRMFNPTPYTFVPERGKTESFTTTKGVVYIGTRTNDGMTGYTPHRCFV